VVSRGSRDLLGGVVFASGVVTASLVAGCARTTPAPAAGRALDPSTFNAPAAPPSPDASLDTEGPACRLPGPTVEAKPTGFSLCGRKPPLGCQSYDLHIRNEGPDAWLVLDGFGTFPLMTSKLVVDRNVGEPVYRWSFEGVSATMPSAKVDDLKFGGFTAFYVGAGSDVTIKDVVISMNARSATASLRFVDRLVIERRPATDWLGHYATLPRQGEATLRGGWEPVIQREVGFPEHALAQLHVLCVQQIPTSRTLAQNE
jgi:hypothetical protein